MLSSFTGLPATLNFLNSIYFSIINIKLDRLFACHRVIGVDMGYIPYKPARPVLELFDYNFILILRLLLQLLRLR